MGNWNTPYDDQDFMTWYKSMDLVKKYLRVLNHSIHRRHGIEDQSTWIQY